MTEDVSIKSPVGANLLDRVERECYEILLQQRLLYNERWYSSPLFSKAVPLLRAIGIALSILGAALCVFYLVYPSSCPKWFFAEMYLLFFVATGLVFYVLPRIEAKLIARMKGAGGPGCRRMAARLVAKARKRVPYEAQYDIKGDLMTYYCGKDNNWQQLWCRRLKGFAIVGGNATLFFRKPTSIQPTMLILYENNQALVGVLERLGISHHSWGQTTVS